MPRDGAGRRAGSGGGCLGATLRTAAPRIRLGDPDGRSPDSGLTVGPFLAVAAWLRAGGFSAPEVLAADEERGLVLLEDLGDSLFARLCAETPGREGGLYRGRDRSAGRDAAAAPPAGAWTPPPYDLAFLQREARLAIEWYIPAATGRPVPADVAAEFDSLAAAAFAPVARPDVPVYRDYHAENLIWLPDRAGHARVGLLDFQDMLVGHPAYDLVSLLEDARRDVGADLRRSLQARYVSRERGRPGGARPCRKRAGVPAQPQDRRPLHPPLPSRRQAALSRPAAPGLAPSLRRPRASGAGAAGALRRPAPACARRPCARSHSGPEMTPDAVMIFAAGLGTRMGDLTRDRPKPLIPVGGRPLIDHALALARGCRRSTDRRQHPCSFRADARAPGPGRARRHDLARTGTARDRRRPETRLADAGVRTGVHAERRHGLARSQSAGRARRVLDAPSGALLASCHAPPPSDTPAPAISSLTRPAAF